MTTTQHPDSGKPGAHQSLHRTRGGSVSAAPGHDWRATLRRQKARAVDGQPDGGYISEFEIICRDCGDDPGWEYHDVAPRLQRIRGPYQMGTGVTQYQAHVGWHEELDRAR